MSDRDEEQFLKDFTVQTLIRDYLGPNPGNPFSPYEARDAVWDWDGNVRFITPTEGEMSDDMTHDLAHLGARLLKEGMIREELESTYNDLVKTAQDNLSNSVGQAWISRKFN